MEQIETQVSDLRYLAQAPVPGPLSESPASAGGGGGGGGGGAGGAAYETPQPHSQGPMSPGSASIGDNSALFAGTETGASGNKRRAEDDQGREKQTRSKRNRVSFSGFPFSSFSGSLSFRRVYSLYLSPSSFLPPPGSGTRAVE